ncbi:YoaK family protein [Streptomyces shaanxiensis]
MPVPARSVPLPKVLIDLTAVTGIVDVVAFLRLGQVFTAFMTGNILFLGFAAAGGEGLALMGSLTAPAGFVTGAVVGSRLGVATAARLRRWLLASAAIASVLLVAAALAAIGLKTVRGALVPRHYAVIALTALAMGVRSAAMWRLGVILNTTLVTGTQVTWIRKSTVGGGTPDAFQSYRAAALVAVFAGAAGVLAGIGGYVAHPASRRKVGA